MSGFIDMISVDLIRMRSMLTKLSVQLFDQFKFRLFLFFKLLLLHPIRAAAHAATGIASSIGWPAGELTGSSG